MNKPKIHFESTGESPDKPKMADADHPKIAELRSSLKKLIETLKTVLRYNRAEQIYKGYGRRIKYGPITVNGQERPHPESDIVQKWRQTLEELKSRYHELNIANEEIEEEIKVLITTAEQTIGDIEAIIAAEERDRESRKT